MGWFKEHKKFYCPQCKEGRRLPHPYHGGCMKCGHKLELNKKNDKKD